MDINMAAFSFHAWILLGGESTRKGSVIRSLTGIARNRDCEVSLTSGQRLRIATQVMSINEGAEPKTPKEWVGTFLGYSSLNGLRARYNVLIALRLDLGTPGFEATDYVREFIAVGAHIESIVTLGQTSPQWVVESGVPHGQILDVTAPTNHITSTVGRYWGWE